MSNGHGGPRTPAHPAPPGSSGPGALSKRTDGHPGQPVRLQTDQAYGDREASLQQQQSAPVYQQQSAPPMPVPSGGGQGSPQGVAFGAPSQRPGEPITHGVDIGPGAGPEVLGMSAPGVQPSGYLTNLLQGMSASDTTGTLGQLYLMAKQRGV